MHPILEMNNRIAALERRVGGAMRHGTVEEVDTKAGWVRLDLGGGPTGHLVSPKVPYAQIAGALKVHTPPSIGQQMTLIAPSGDMRQAIALPMTWSNMNEAPDHRDFPVLTFGEVRAEIREDQIRVEIGGFILSISAAGLAMQGGGVGHNGQDIGSTHRHPGVTPGNGVTLPPIASGPIP